MNSHCGKSGRGKSSTRLNESQFIMLLHLDAKLVGLWTILATWNQDTFTHTGLSQPTLCKSLFFLFSYVFSITTILIGTSNMHDACTKIIGTLEFENWNIWLVVFIDKLDQCVFCCCCCGRPEIVDIMWWCWWCENEVCCLQEQESCNDVFSIY